MLEIILVILIFVIVLQVYLNHLNVNNYKLEIKRMEKEIGAYKNFISKNEEENVKNIEEIVKIVKEITNNNRLYFNTKCNYEYKNINQVEELRNKLMNTNMINNVVADDLYIELNEKIKYINKKYVTDRLANQNQLRKKIKKDN